TELAEARPLLRVGLGVEKSRGDFVALALAELEEAAVLIGQRRSAGGHGLTRAWPAGRWVFAKVSQGARRLRQGDSVRIFCVPRSMRFYPTNRIRSQLLHCTI